MSVESSDYDLAGARVEFELDKARSNGKTMFSSTEVLLFEADRPDMNAIWQVLFQSMIGDVAGNYGLVQIDLRPARSNKLVLREPMSSFFYSLHEQPLVTVADKDVLCYWDYSCTPAVQRRAPTRRELFAQMRAQRNVLFLFHYPRSNIPAQMLYFEASIGRLIAAQLYVTLVQRDVLIPLELDVLQNVLVSHNAFRETRKYAELSLPTFFLDRAFDRHSVAVRFPTFCTKRTVQHAAVDDRADAAKFCDALAANVVACRSDNNDVGTASTGSSQRNGENDCADGRAFGSVHTATHAFSDRLQDDERLEQRVRDVLAAAFEIFRCVGNDVYDEHLTHTDLFYLLQLMHVERETNAEPSSSSVPSQDYGIGALQSRSERCHRLMLVSAQAKSAAREVVALPYTFLMQGTEEARRRFDLTLAMTYGALHKNRLLTTGVRNFFANCHYGDLLNSAQRLACPASQYASALADVSTVELQRVREFIDRNALVGDRLRLQRLCDGVGDEDIICVRVPLNNDTQARGSSLKANRFARPNAFLLNRVTPSALVASVRNVVRDARDGADFLVLYTPMSYVPLTDRRYVHCVDVSADRAQLVAQRDAGEQVGNGAWGVVYDLHNENAAAVAHDLYALRAQKSGDEQLASAKRKRTVAPSLLFQFDANERKLTLQGGDSELLTQLTTPASAAVSDDGEETAPEQSVIKKVKPKRGRPRKPSNVESAVSELQSGSANVAAPRRRAGRPSKAELAERERLKRVREAIEGRPANAWPTFAEPALYVCLQRRLYEQMQRSFAPHALYSRACGAAAQLVALPMAAPTTATLLTHHVKECDIDTLCTSLNAFTTLLGGPRDLWHSKAGNENEAQRVRAVTQQLAPLADFYASFHVDDDDAKKDDVQPNWFVFVTEELLAPLDDAQRVAETARAETRVHAVSRVLHRRNMLRYMMRDMVNVDFPLDCAMEAHERATDNTFGRRRKRKRDGEESEEEEEDEDAAVVVDRMSSMYNAFTALLGAHRFEVLAERKHLKVLERACADDATLVAHMARVQRRIKERGERVETAPGWYARNVRCDNRPFDDEDAEIREEWRDDSSWLQRAADLLRAGDDADDEHAASVPLASKVTCSHCGTMSLAQCVGMAQRLLTERDATYDSLRCCVCLSYDTITDCDVASSVLSASRVSDGIFVGICTHCRTRTPRGDGAALVDWREQCTLYDPFEDAAHGVDFAHLVDALLRSARAHENERVGVRDTLSALSLQFRHWSTQPWLPRSAQKRSWANRLHESVLNYVGAHFRADFDDFDQMRALYWNVDDCSRTVLHGWLTRKELRDNKSIDSVLSELLLSTNDAVRTPAKGEAPDGLRAALPLVQCMTLLELCTVVPMATLHVLYDELRWAADTSPCDVKAMRSITAYGCALRDMVMPLSSVEHLANYLCAFESLRDERFLFFDSPLARSSAIGGSWDANIVNDWRVDRTDHEHHLVDETRNTVRPWTNTLPLEDALLNFYDSAK